MSISAKFRQIMQSIQQLTSQIIDYILSAFARIFAPRDDNYPPTGTQPFEGDPPRKKHY
ncbi:hypothetical protein I8751_18845 [Nostocaceae cyanobacterium CENA357]|uniref:Isochorismate synthase n=1 Tax=Atlanticothrix silvestris CENA357 TaxID=1725252 RepID=A0A8J7HG75_9CYAN|nr:hypothetical protein [Atlanticothrix silvestris]MBH8554386.1 hypothetical protein [Atlanticothrix silvestris CENA357]